MSSYGDVLVLAQRLEFKDRLRLIAQLSSSIPLELEADYYRQLPWRVFIEKTFGILENNPIHHFPELPVETREGLK
jgi:hypothetical protein